MAQNKKKIFFFLLKKVPKNATKKVKINLKKNIVKKLQENGP